VSSIEDPLLKELLTSFREDSHQVAADLLQGITTQAMIAAFALFLAISSLIRLVFFELSVGPPGAFRARPGMEASTVVDTTLTLVLLILSMFSFYNLVKARRRYSRILALAERLGR
jgi:hypothetical protein